MPEGWSGLLSFLLFFAPGSLYAASYASRRPTRRSSVLEETNRVIVASLAAWLLPALVGLVPRIWWPWWFAPLERALAGPRDLWMEPVGGLIALGSFLAALGVAWSLARTATRKGSANIVPGTTTWLLVHGRRPSGTRPYLWVETERLRVGGWYLAGDLSDEPDSSRDLVLSKPVTYVWPGGRKAVDEISPHVLLRGDHILRWAVHYYVDGVQKAKRRGRWRRAWDELAR